MNNDLAYVMVLSALPNAARSLPTSPRDLWRQKIYSLTCLFAVAVLLVLAIKL